MDGSCYPTHDDGTVMNWPPRFWGERPPRFFGEKGGEGDFRYGFVLRDREVYAIAYICDGVCRLWLGLWASEGAVHVWTG